jgi:NADH:ubiquinone oxidoreductase subunit F (NADH-binding)
MKDLRKYPYKRVDIMEIQKYSSIDDYEEFVRTANGLEEKNILSPVKSSKLNGKRPP